MEIGRGNMKKLVFGMTLLLFSYFFPGIVSADSMRCGKRVISTGATKGKVLVTCGEPILREIVETKGSEQTEGEIQNLGFGRSEFSSSTDSFITKVEIWTYNLGENQFLRILTFEGSKLVSIELGDKP